MARRNQGLSLSKDLFFFKKIYSFENRMIERERKKEREGGTILSSAGSFPIWPKNSQDWAKLSPGAWGASSVSLRWVASLLSQHQQGAGSKEEDSGFKPVLRWVAAISLTC